MKTRLLKRLRRKAERQVCAKWDGYELTVVWCRPVGIFEWENVKYENGGRRENEDFYYSGGTVFDDIDDLKKGLTAARRCAVLQMVNRYRNEIIKNKIKNL